MFLPLCYLFFAFFPEPSFELIHELTYLCVRCVCVLISATWPLGTARASRPVVSSFAPSFISASGDAKAGGTACPQGITQPGAYVRCLHRPLDNLAREGASVSADERSAASGIRHTGAKATCAAVVRTVGGRAVRPRAPRELSLQPRPRPWSPGWPTVGQFRHEVDAKFPL